MQTGIEYTHNRLFGIALIASGILLALGFTFHPHDSVGSNLAGWLSSHTLIMLGLFFNLLGIGGLYLANSARIGWVGLLGFLVIGCALVLYIGKLYWSGFVYPLVVSEHPEFISRHGFGPGSEPINALIRFIFFSGAILYMLGHLLLGGALLKNNCYRRAPLFFFVGGAVLVGLWPLLPAVLQHWSIVVSAIYGVGIVWLGVIMRGQQQT